VLRFRTIRLPGEAPEVTPPAPPHVAPEPRGRRDDRGRRDGSDRGRDSGAREAPRQTEEAPAPEVDAEVARAEEAVATDAPPPAADASAADTGTEPAAN
jgi:hypothetical protein